jgi:uncharacterized protein
LEVTTVFSLLIIALLTGFIDAVVGGGGLIQLPGMLLLFPRTTIATILGTGKIASLCGTATAAYQYSKQMVFDKKLLLAIGLTASIASYIGAQLLQLIDTKSIKPFILIILVLLFIYTLAQKQLGQSTTKYLSQQKQIVYGCVIGFAIGLYDGIFGPGTGSFLVLAFVVVLGFPFIQASAYAKVINCITNAAALLVFIPNKNFMLQAAIVLAIGNISGNLIGSKMAIKKGNAFVRIVFIVVVGFLICRFAWDIFKQ